MDPMEYVQGEALSYELLTFELCTHFSCPAARRREYGAFTAAVRGDKPTHIFHNAKDRRNLGLVAE